MQISKAGLVLGISVLVGACAGAQKPSQQYSAANLDCQSIGSDTLTQLSNVKSVETLYRTEFRARAIQPRFVSGAALHVPAQPGISAAYLERALSCHAAQTASVAHNPDPLRVAGVESVDVRESGAMMRVSITSTNVEAAKQIVQQAEALKSTRGTTTVEQLSAAPAQHSAF